MVFLKNLWNILTARRFELECFIFVRLFILTYAVEIQNKEK